MWMQGGPSHIDTLDPKPDAPVEIRGEFKTIPTTLPGKSASPNTCRNWARLTDLYSIIRGTIRRTAATAPPITS
jgi:hypothetical protein